MSLKNSLTRRQALLLSSAGAAGLALGGLPNWARGAPAAARPLPIPTLIEARNGEPVTLTLQKTRHRFGTGAAVPSTGISSSYLGPVVRVRSGDTIPFRVENRLDEETTLHWHGLLIPSDMDGGPHNTIKPGGVWTPELKINQPAATHWFHPHPAWEYGEAGLWRTRRHDDRQRRRRPRPWPARDLWRRRPSDRAAGQAVRTQRRTRLFALHDGRHARLPGRHARGQRRDRAGRQRARRLRAAAPVERGECPQLRSSLLRPAAVLRRRQRWRIASGTGGSAQPRHCAGRTLRNPGEFFRWTACGAGHWARYASRNGPRR